MIPLNSADWASSEYNPIALLPRAGTREPACWAPRKPLSGYNGSAQDERLLMLSNLPEEFPNPAPNPPLPLADDAPRRVGMCE